MFGLPIGLIVRVVGALVAVVAIWLAWEHFIANPYREQGRVEVRKQLQPKLDVDEKLIADARTRAANLVLDYQAMQTSLEAERKQRAADNTRNAVTLAAAVAHVPVGISVALPSVLGGVFDAATDFATGSHAGASAGTGVALPASAQATTESYDAAAIGGYIADAARAYKSERDGRLSCEDQYDSARAAQMKGAT